MTDSSPTGAATDTAARSASEAAPLADGSDEAGHAVPAEARARPPKGPEGHVRLVAVLVTIGSVLLLAIGTFAVLTGGNGDPGTADSDDGWNGAQLGEPIERPDFTLTDTEGQAFDFQAETSGELTLLFFGYTNCPDICPIQMAVIASALGQPNTPRPNVVFVTTDPERDTPERLRTFLDQFDSQFVGLTGTQDEVDAAERAADVAPSTKWSEEGGEPADGEEDYDVFHASQVIAFTPDDHAHVVYPQGVRQQDWVEDLPRLLEEHPAR